MKKTLLLLFFACALRLCHAQNAPGNGQFSFTVSGFAPVGTCQPGPAPAFTPCALPSPSLGVPYDVLLPTVGTSGTITCSVSSGALPSWATLTSNGTSCEIKGTPTVTGPVAAFTIAYK